MNSTIIRWGIIGVGNVCETKSGPAFYQAENSQLLAVMRRDMVKAKDFALRHQVPYWYNRADELLANPEIDAIYIATPPAQHKPYALAALAAGKNVYIEKPVALNARECSAIIEAHERTRGSHHANKICVAHYRRALPSFLKIKALIDSGAIGKPLLARIDMLRPAARPTTVSAAENWRLNPSISGGGLFHDLGPHQLDLMVHWFGPVTEASGLGINQRQLHSADDCVHGWALFQCGVTLQGRWHFSNGPEPARDLCEIIGTAGTLHFNFFGDQIIHLQTASGTEHLQISNPYPIQGPMIDRVNRYFRGEEPNPCSIYEARAVMELMDCFSRHSTS